jgi:hypothetical protein
VKLEGLALELPLTQPQDILEKAERVVRGFVVEPDSVGAAEVV